MSTPSRWTDRPIVQLTLARLREFYREPAAVFWVYGFPLLLAVALGIAFQDRPAAKIPIDVVNSPGAEEFVEQLRRQSNDQLIITLSDEDTARNRLRTGRTELVVSLGDIPGRVSYLSDPNRPGSVLARAAAENALLRPSNTDTNSKPRDSFMTENGSRYIDFLMPGLIGANLMGGGLWGVGFVTVDMRVRKLLKRFLATPMKKRDFLMALMFSRLVFTLVEIILLLSFGWLVFGVSIRGNIAALGILFVLGGVCFSGIGLLVACRAKTIETVSGLMNAVMLPMYVTSGVFFPADRFPEAVQPVLNLLPLTVLNNGIREVMTEGAGFESLGKPILVLGVWTVVSFLLALRFFRWR
jgi:ABC-type multidrug transport system permease subunit